MADRLTPNDWSLREDEFSGRFEGAQIGAEVTVLFVSIDEVGGGPPLHTHPYDEIFIIRSGRGRYTVGDEVIEAGRGDVLRVPAEVPHKFENLGPGPLESVDIHQSPRFIQTDLE
ncbi:mannose-6-phosphate isomerase-like protein (cupin superfamily) [Litoreibacter ponti]|uniref:Mannose-6-phosphate isomerase-like protein (Cupin superfamily) n=1 Tax=Litoreibacter ponti TaxID=1510457 RepID=A0A2T6BPS1_9RHOB|nr:cupin domain-containing protein [Litoreibacter ponti]PTX58068.1 mannose-6-phosphate isomerase-like protein (cupin superfamily) [Litoreibacter ponti]